MTEAARIEDHGAAENFRRWIDSLQFYPTPKNIALKMWSKFKNKHFTRILEPSAGAGDLILGCDRYSEQGGHHRYSNCTRTIIDCCEIDMSKHARLRDLSMTVVGLDFLDFKAGAVYSHIIQNPPFAHGCAHVLHAWNILWDGEIVSVINAETLRNPFSKERQLLARLIERHGNVEFVTDGFSTEETQRRNSVEVAILYLRKEAEDLHYLDGILDGLDQDAANGSVSEFPEAHELAIPLTVIENQVLIFDNCVAAWTETKKAEARSIRFTNRLGQTMVQATDERSGAEGGDSIGYVRKEMASKYDELKDRAWTIILRGSNVNERLSTSAQKRIESDFENIKKLSFTTRNIYGFLLGLSQSAGDIQQGMILDVFDHISRYHEENACFYRGWISNGRHRSMGMRIKMTRFILPHFGQNYGGSISWENRKRLSDFDKVFCLLDGKSTCDVSLVDMFENEFSKLRHGARIEGTYFSVRYYSGVGTIHFFPKRKDLIDRMNRMVGKLRAWLPQEPESTAAGFWANYDKAESFNTEIRAAVAKAAREQRNNFGWQGPLGEITRGDSSCGQDATERQQLAQSLVDAVVMQVQERHGVDADLILEDSRTRSPQLCLVQ